MQVIAATGIIIAVEYPTDPLEWARLYDNQLIGWTIDETGTAEPVPSIIGQLPTAAGDAPMVSPQWASFSELSVLVPDLWRGPTDDFFTFMATNSGGKRPLAAEFRLSIDLFNAFNAWAVRNPTLVANLP